MRKTKDILYYCRRCNRDFPVAGYIAKEIVMFDKKAWCPKCGKNDVTERVGGPPKQKGSLTDPPSTDQLDYIRGLGGDPRNIRTKADAGELITRLKKEKGIL